MPFPLSHTGQLEISYVNRSIESIITSVQDGLEKVNAINIVRNEKDISFSGGFFLSISSWHILTAISFGKISVRNLNNKISIKYYLNFRVFLIVSLILILGLLAPISFFYSNPAMPLEKLVWVIYLILGWLFLFGGNYLITIIRFPCFIQKIVQSG